MQLQLTHVSKHYSSNTAQACAATDRFLRESPDAGILLCTDDGADVPYLLVAGATPGYRRLERLARWSGLYAGLSSLGRKQIGRALPFPVLMRYYARAPHRWLRKLLRSVFSALASL